MARTFVSLFGSGGDYLPIAATSAVLYDNTTNVMDNDHNGTATLNHTATGSNLAAFVHITYDDGGGGVSSVTYNGVAMTQAWLARETSSGVNSAGYYLAGIPSGVSAVTATTVDGVTTYLAISCTTMTNVNQTVPVGTPQSTNLSTTNGTMSVTVGAVTANDLVCDGWGIRCNAGIVIGANQTSRQADDAADGTDFARCSTQLGADGGVMSWVVSGSSFLIYAGGAIAFKPV